MYYLFIILAVFIILMLLTQIVFFEISRNRMLKASNLNWFMALDRPFSYRRYGYMFFICFICYMISSPTTPFTLGWVIYFILFLAMGIVADAVVQYLTNIYAKKRCRKQIEESYLLQSELMNLAQTMGTDYENIEEEEKSFKEIEYLDQYINEQTHLAYICVDQGKFIKEHARYTEATFDVEPYGSIEVAKATLEGTPVQATKLTPSNQLPFKDEKMDTIMCQYSNYDKLEVERVLKHGGYFIVHQNGTSNFKEFLQMYVPYGIKGTWDAFSCAQTLESIGMRIVDKVEDYRTIRFRSLEAIHTYFLKHSPDLVDINRYQLFYMNALKEIKENGFYELTSHQFLVVAQKL